MYTIIRDGLKKSQEKRKYPFADMQVGDCFMIGGDPKEIQKIRSAASIYGSNHGKTFSVRRYQDGWKCGREN